MFSVALYPPQPVARWPELTLVAARAVADAIGDGATIKHPNDVLVDGRKAAGILAEASERVVLGIGINVGGTDWPGAGWVEADRLDLLVDVLDRLERGYDDWLPGVHFRHVKRLLLAAFLLVAVAAPGRAAAAPKVLAIHFTQDVNPVTQDWLNGQLDTPSRTATPPR